MAIITTNVVLSNFLEYLPYEGLSDLDRIPSNVPILQAEAQSRDNIPLSGAGDNQRLAINLQFPTGFAWLLSEVCLALFHPAAGNFWSSRIVGEWRFVNLDSRQFFNMTCQQSSTITSQPSTTQTGSGYLGLNDRVAVYRPDSIPTQILLPRELNQIPQLLIDTINPVANEAQYESYVYARAVAFRLEQARNFELHTPGLVYGHTA